MNKWIVQPLTNLEEAQRKKWYHYTESAGLDNVWLENGVERHETSYGSGIRDLDGLNAATGSLPKKAIGAGPR